MTARCRVCFQVLQLQLRRGLSRAILASDLLIGKNLAVGLSLRLRPRQRRVSKVIQVLLILAASTISVRYWLLGLIVSRFRDQLLRLAICDLSRVDLRLRLIQISSRRFVFVLEIVAVIQEVVRE